VRAGRITLAQAQQAIGENWTIALRRLGLRPGPCNKTAA
jgi:hypothetical protein